MAWSYGLQPLRERSVKIFERHDVFAVFEARPTDSHSGFLFTSAAAAYGFGSCSFFELVKFVHTGSLVSDNSTGASFPRRSTCRYEIFSMCCALRRAALGAILSLISLRTVRARGQGVRVSSDLCDIGTAERTTIVKEREKNAACCMLRDAKRRTTLMRSDFAGATTPLSLHSLSHKLESLQASYPHM